MTNSNIFREPGSGEYSCPSGCFGPENCSKATLIAALAESSGRLAELTDPKREKFFKQVWSDGMPIRVEAKTMRAIQWALASSCLRYHLAAEGNLTD